MNPAQRRLNIMAGAAPNIQSPSADPSPHRLATGIFLVYLFLLMSRGVETLAIVLRVNLHLTLILMLVSLMAAILTGGLMRAVKTPVVLLFTALTGWLVFTIFTSQWRGGSFQTIMNVWLPTYFCVLLIPSLISSLNQCRKAYYALAFSLVPMVWSTLAFGAQVQGRDRVFGTLGNPNDLAFSLLLLIPFAVFVIKNEFVLSWKTIVCAIAIGYAVIKTLKTGSRAGLLTMATCAVVLLIKGRARTKVTVLGWLAVIVVVSFVIVPGDVLLRYSTILSGTSAESGMSADEYSAVESTRARKMLFGESVRLTLEHPLFGVGPGIFSAALATEQKQAGKFQTWHEAHNSFTQLSSEAGLPALGIYLALLFYCTKRTIGIYRRTRDDPNQIVICRMAAALAMTLLIFIVCGAFGNYAYSFHFPVLAGLAQAFIVCVSEEIQTAPVIVPARLQRRSGIPRLDSPAPSCARKSQLPPARGLTRPRTSAPG